MFGGEFPAPWTVEVLAYSEDSRDAHGNPVPSWADPGSVQPVYGWAPPSASSEPFEQGRDAVVRDLDVYAAPSFSAGPHDRVRVDGALYAVVGFLSDFNHGPFGYAPGVVLALKRVDG